MKFCGHPVYYSSLCMETNIIKYFTLACDSLIISIHELSCFRFSNFSMLVLSQSSFALRKDVRKKNIFLRGIFILLISNLHSSP